MDIKERERLEHQIRDVQATAKPPRIRTLARQLAGQIASATGERPDEVIERVMQDRPFIVEKGG